MGFRSASERRKTMTFKHIGDLKRKGGDFPCLWV